MVCILRIFAEGELHGGGSLYRHIVDPLPVGFKSRKLSRHRVCASGAGNDCGNSRHKRFIKAVVPGVHRIHRPKLGGCRVGVLVAVVPFKACSVRPHSYVAVSVDKSGVYGHSRKVIALLVLWAKSHWSDIYYLAAFY